MAACGEYWRRAGHACPVVPREGLEVAAAVPGGVPEPK
jgi:hypothetical protein